VHGKRAEVKGVYRFADDGNAKFCPEKKSCYVSNDSDAQDFFLSNLGSCLRWADIKNSNSNSALKTCRDLHIEGKVEARCEGIVDSCWESITVDEMISRMFMLPYPDQGMGALPEQVVPAVRERPKPE